MVLYLLAVVAVAGLTVAVVVVRGLRRADTRAQTAGRAAGRREHDAGQRLPPPGDHRIDLPHLHAEGEEHRPSDDG